jgi:elongation factor Ts
MAIDTKQIQTLREETGVGMMDAKRALEAAGGDMRKAITELRTRGQKIAAQKSQRQVKEGVIGNYVHANKKVAAIVTLACETDFVARTDDFQALAKDIAMHIAAMNPLYLQPADVPPAVLAQEEEIYRQQLQREGKPEAMWPKILPGKLKKFYADTCLLDQAFVKDDGQTIGDLLTAATAKLGENIRILGFHRLAL